MGRWAETDQPTDLSPGPRRRIGCLRELNVASVGALFCSVGKWATSDFRRFLDQIPLRFFFRVERAGKALSPRACSGYGLGVTRLILGR